nr:hypothetical protein [Nonomuraea terrae]
MAAYGLEEKALDLLLADKGLVKTGGKQRTDSTHVIAAVRDLNRLEMAGECVRAGLEALSAAAPGWVEQVLEVGGWTGRYRARVGFWQLPTSETKRAELARAYGADGYALVSAVYAPFCPAWLRQLPAVQALRVMLIQNSARVVDNRGREVVKRRESLESGGEGLPPGRYRLTSPYDADARWAAKGDDLFWNGYKVHVSETCDNTPDAVAAAAGTGEPQPPNLITNVTATDATAPDSQATDPIHQALARRGLLPAEYYLDSGYPSAELLVARGRNSGSRWSSPCCSISPRKHAPGPGSTAPRSPSTGTTGRSPARRARVTHRGYRAPSAAPTRSASPAGTVSLARSGRRAPPPPSGDVSSPSAISDVGVGRDSEGLAADDR